jgi:hypothetical protein
VNTRSLAALTAKKNILLQVEDVPT